MDVDVARALTAGQKIRYWDGRIATVSAVYSPPVALRASEKNLIGPSETGGDIGIVFDDEADPQPIHYIKDYDLRLAEPL